MVLCVSLPGVTHVKVSVGPLHVCGCLLDLAQCYGLAQCCWLVVLAACLSFWSLNERAIVNLWATVAFCSCQVN